MGRFALLAVLVILVLALPVGFFWQGLVKQHQFDAVPASAFPNINGVTVLTSKVTTTMEAQDSDSGNRHLVVAAAPDANGAATFDLVTSGLTAAGWQHVACHNGPSRSRCFQNAGFWASVQYPPTPTTNQLFIIIERAPCSGWFC